MVYFTNNTKRGKQFFFFVFTYTVFVKYISRDIYLRTFSVSEDDPRTLIVNNMYVLTGFRLIYYLLRIPVRPRNSA